jgi:hypothetical protein
MNRVQHLELIQTQARELFARKNQDYGDAFAKHGPVGVLIRIGDKLDRYLSVSNTSVNLVKDEKLRDTLIDMHNYAAMAIMLLDNTITNKSNNNDSGSGSSGGSSGGDKPTSNFFPLDDRMVAEF